MNTENPTETTQGAQAVPERRPSTLTLPTPGSDAERAFRRIPDAEATAFPWWVIIDPARLSLPCPEDAQHGVCPVCGVDTGERCRWVKSELDEVNTGARITRAGTIRPDVHDERPDYRSAVSAGNVYPTITGPFFSREAAQAQVDRRPYAYSDRTQVWCLSGHESRDWRSFCAESRKPAKPVTLERSDGHVVDFDPWFVSEVRGVRTGTVLDERPELGAVVCCVDDSMHLVVGTHRDVAERVVRARAGL
ncbi:MAG: hypothetical protein RIS45_1511 [Planctomycetota bacterium]|jgi:hypothetical protein